MAVVRQSHGQTLGHSANCSEDLSGSWEAEFMN